MLRTSFQGALAMNFLYEDVYTNRYLIHSERRGQDFVLQLIDRYSGAVTKEQQFSNWNSYSQQYDMLRTMLPVIPGG
jgi:hypothetical protein